ncbi:MAG: transposase [Thermus sp.]|uniref:transposase n=1 Tax=Thermus sp. TaxID=275 RepID=UPI00391971E0
MKKTKSLPPQVKFQIALEVLKGEKSAVEIARAYGLHPNTVYKYRGHGRSPYLAELLSKEASLFSDDTQEKEYEMLCPEGKQMGEDPGTGSALQGYLAQLIGKKERGGNRPPKKAKPTLRVTLGQGR